MTRYLIGAGLLAAAAAWVGLLSLSNPTAAEPVSVPVPARDGSVAVLKYVDKSRFDQRDPATGRTGEITLRLDVLDAAKQPIVNLRKEDFTVTEEGVVCPVKAFRGPA